MKISTHAPAWGRRARIARGPLPLPFLLAPPRGGRHRQHGSAVRGKNFYSRPRVGGDPEFDSIVVELREFLLTPPYGGRHHFVIKGCVGVGISTHAPEWGAHTPARHAAGRNRRVTAVKGGSAPSHPRQNQSSPSGSASQTIGEKGSGLKPIRTPLGTLSSFTTAS